MERMRMEELTVAWAWLEHFSPEMESFTVARLSIELFRKPRLYSVYE